MATLVVSLLVALLLGVAFGIAAGPALVVLVVLAILLALGWLGVLLFSGRSPGRVADRTKRAEILGPGGPDDPDARRVEHGEGRRQRAAGTESRGT